MMNVGLATPSASAPEPPRQAADEARLAGAELAFEADQLAAVGRGAEALPERLGLGGARRLDLRTTMDPPG
jgi:hypothetical protein